MRCELGLALAVLLPAAAAAQTTTGRLVQLTSAPTPGGVLSLTVHYPAAAAGGLYGMFWGLETPPTPLPVPVIRGLGRLRFADVALGPLYVHVLGAGRRTVGPPVPVPNQASLIGAEFATQSADVQISEGLVYLSDNVARVTTTAGIGTVILLEGSLPSTITGDFVAGQVSNTSVGQPTNQGVPAGAFQPIRHHGQRGWVAGFPADFVATPGASDIHVLRRDRVARNLVNGVLQTIALPNGFDLAVLRESADCKRFALVSFDRSAGTARVLSGSAFADSAVTCPPTSRFSIYREQFAFTDDGATAAAIVHDSANQTGPDRGPADRVVLIKTDPAQTFGNGRNVLDVSPTTSPVHRFVPDTLRIANGVLFVEAEGAGGITLHAGPVDGSALLRPIPVPRTGTNQPFTRSFGEHRVSANGTTMVFPIGGGTAAAPEDDLVAITGISSSATLTARNITQFASATEMAPLYRDTITPAGIGASLSPDGTRVAFTTGAGSAGAPHELWVTKTDASQAGAPTVVTAGNFDAQVVFVGSVHFATDDRVLFLAGQSFDACDWYAYDVTGATLTNVTNTTTGRTTPPLTQGGTTGDVFSHGTFTSTNGGWLYFVRGWWPRTPQPRNNLVAIDVATLALRDITGNDFGTGGTAPDIYRGALTTLLAMTATPTPALGLQLRRAPTGNDVFFVAENAGAPAGQFHDCNVFRFDVENAGRAVQVTGNTIQGALAEVALINHLTISPDGGHVAYAQRLADADAPEAVHVVPATGGSSTKLSAGVAGDTITDGSIAFTGAPADGVVWSRGTGLLSLPFIGTVVEWSRIQGQANPLLLTLPPELRPQSVILVLGASPTNQ